MTSCSWIIMLLIVWRNEMWHTGHFDLIHRRIWMVLSMSFVFCFFKPLCQHVEWHSEMDRASSAGCKGYLKFLILWLLLFGFCSSCKCLNSQKETETDPKYSNIIMLIHFIHRLSSIGWKFSSTATQNHKPTSLARRILTCEQCEMGLRRLFSPQWFDYSFLFSTNQLLYLYKFVNGETENNWLYWL